MEICDLSKRRKPGSTYRIHCCYRMEKSSVGTVGVGASSLDELRLVLLKQDYSFFLFGSVYGHNRCIIFMLLLLDLKTSEHEDYNLPVKVLK